MISHAILGIMQNADQKNLRFDASESSQWKMVGDRLQVMATVSRVVPEGLPYLLSDGQIVHEIVTADELFDPDSLDTARIAPVTFGHPECGLVKNDWSKHSVGASGSAVVARKDDGYLDLVLTIGDKEVIDAAMKASDKGKNLEISAGYTTIVKQDGDNLYQTQRRYDHFAVLPENSRGRAGEAVSLHMDNSELDWGVLIKNDAKDKNMKYVGRLDEASIDLINDAIALKMGEASHDIKQAIADKLNIKKSDVEDQLWFYYETPTDEFIKAAAETLDIDVDALLSAAKLSREINEKREKLRKDEKEIKMTNIVIDNRGYEITSENNDADDLAKKVSAILKSDSANKKEAEEAKADSATLQESLDSANAKLKEKTEKVDELNTQLESANTKLDSDQVADLMKDCIDTWASALPTLIKADSEFKPNYSTAPVDIKRMFLKAVKDDLADNPKFKNDSYVEGLFEALKPSSNEVTPAPKKDQMSDTNLKQLLGLAQGKGRVDSALSEDDNTEADNTEEKEDSVSLDDVKALYSYDNRRNK